MNFFEFYLSISDNVEKRKLRQKIISACQIQQPTFYRWLAKRSVPALPQKVIADILKVPIEELFPIEENENLIIN